MMHRTRKYSRTFQATRHLVEGLEKRLFLSAAIAAFEDQQPYLTGHNPLAVAVSDVNRDGKVDLAVANFFGKSVMKLRPSDGVVIGTFPVDDGAAGLAVAGPHLWVANSGTDRVTELRILDGRVVERFRVGKTPAAVAFDGTHIWVPNSGSNTVSKRQAVGPA